jgi:signal transduction histidine kinase
MVRGDRQLIGVALQNLLENAWKFTGKTAQPMIEFGVGGDGEQQTFFVRDNGAGFDPAFSEKLFKPFERLHRVQDFEGTGIGLATVGRVVRKHGGTIRAEAALNQGATFFFCFEPHRDPAS